MSLIRCDYRKYEPALDRLIGDEDEFVETSGPAGINVELLRVSCLNPKVIDPFNPQQLHSRVNLDASHILSGNLRDLRRDYLTALFLSDPSKMPTEIPGWGYSIPDEFPEEWDANTQILFDMAQSFRELHHKCCELKIVDQIAELADSLRRSANQIQNPFKVMGEEGS